METIRNYLDNMFRTIPYTPESARLKADLLAGMEDKYNELKAEGKTENEAVGSVISEFGNINELFEEMNIPSEQGGAGRPFGRVVGEEEAVRFMDAGRISALLVAGGIFLIIMAPACFVLVQNMATRLSGQRMEIVGFAFFFSMIAVAVGMFIYSGYLNEPYKHLRQEPFILSSEAYRIVERRVQSIRSWRILSTIGGVALILFSPVIFMAISVLGFADVLGIAALLFMVACAVAGFTHFGIIAGGHDTLLQRRKYSEGVKRSGRVINAVGAVWWPIIVCIYLAWSFSTNNWGFTWIIWPVSGLLFGAFSAAYSIISGEDPRS